MIKCLLCKNKETMVINSNNVIDCPACKVKGNCFSIRTNNNIIDFCYIIHFSSADKCVMLRYHQPQINIIIFDCGVREEMSFEVNHLTTNSLLKILKNKNNLIGIYL